MLPTTPPLQFDYLKGDEIATKHKEAIRQLHWQAKMPVWKLSAIYKLQKKEIYRILEYPAPERARPIRTGRPQKLTDAKIDEIIEYCSENWTNRVLNYAGVIAELKLDYKVSTL
jgi:hypothetical protein